MAKAVVAVLVGWLIAGGIAAAIAASLLEPDQELEDNATAYTVVLAAGLVAQELVLLGAASWFVIRKYRLSWATLGLRKPDRSYWWFAPVLGAAGLVLIYGYVGLLSLMGVDADESMAEQVFDNPGPFLMVVAGAILMAPFIEEVFFRGFLFAGLRERRGWIFAAIVSGVLFGAAHLSVNVLLPFTGIGILFAWSYQYTGSIRPSIIAHVMINLVSFAIGALGSGLV
jgi:membrane protease YdiL (CAAX protease family)